MTRLRHEDLLSISERERIDEVCLAFEDQWLRGERPLVERYLAEGRCSFHGELLHELLLIELEYRRGLGEIPDAADYRIVLDATPRWSAMSLPWCEHRSA